MDEDYVKIALTAEIPPGKMKSFETEDKTILIANIDGNFYAIEGKCDHEGADLSKGTLEGKVLTCPLHKAQYDITTGKVIAQPAKGKCDQPVHDLRSYSLKTDVENILVRL